MRKLGSLIVLAAALAAAPAALAQAPVPRLNGMVRAPEAFQPAIPPVRQPPPAIGTIGGMPVRVWAPVEPPYNRMADRNGAADPVSAGIPWWSLPSMAG